MPIYNFQCCKCSYYWEELTRYDESEEYSDIKCPKCGSDYKEKLVSVSAPPVFSNPRGTSKGDSFSYVAGYNMEQAKEERRRAEESSGVKNPYNNIDDLSSGKNEF